ncbi:MAG: sulfatase-like hydrolase/transferase [Verrucomicrobia bacterium]|nr:sulfatase-like hydrolase/transferase [Verrucomicrobiota bacterium]
MKPKTLFRARQAALWAIFCLAIPGVRAKPNIVFIIADDLGWADLAFHGGNAPTPHLDKLARESIEFTQHYAAATCTPTRVGFLTGRFWSRFGILAPYNNRALPWDTVTLPSALKRVGYATALFGKWHLGAKPEWGPNHYGFDYTYGSLGGGVGPYNHFYKQGDTVETWHHNGDLITEEGHVTDLIANEAVKWIASRREAPFFLYVPFTAVHLPVKEPPSWLDKVPAAIEGGVARHYAASVMHLDDAIGRIIAALEKSGKRENTLLVFTSDNGGSTAENNDVKYPVGDYPSGRLPGNNLPLRGEKTDLYEGGIRVPTIMSWPGKLKPGAFTQPMHIADWMPTFCALTGYKPEKDLMWDGVNMWPAISGPGAQPVARTLYWTTPSHSAVRDGDWKLIVPSGRNAKAGKVELFDLAKDPNETTDLAASMPEKVGALKQKLAAVAKADRDAVVKD